MIRLVFENELSLYIYFLFFRSVYLYIFSFFLFIHQPLDHSRAKRIFKSSVCAFENRFFTYDLYPKRRMTPHLLTICLGKHKTKKNKTLKNTNLFISLVPSTKGTKKELSRILVANKGVTRKNNWRRFD